MTLFRLTVSLMTVLMAVAAFARPGLGASGLGTGQAVQITKGPVEAVISAALIGLALLVLWTADDTE